MKMNHDRNCVKKFSGVYNTSHDIDNLRVRIIIKACDESNNFEESRVFSWQQKAYSKFERQFYGDEKNCITIDERQHHENVKHLTDKEGHLFSYVSEDDVQEERCVLNSSMENELVRKIETLKLDSKSKTKELKDIESDGAFELRQILQEAVENPVLLYDFENMYIMADFGYYEDNIWVKNEHVLCIIKYDRNLQVFFIYPDFTVFDPYLIEFEDEKRMLRSFHYYIEDVSESNEFDFERTTDKLPEKVRRFQSNLRMQSIGDVFELPPANKMRICVLLEILTAKNFEYNDIYVDYVLDLPAKWSCDDQNKLTGNTHTCHSYKKDNLSYFGIPFEICLDYDIKEFEKCSVLEAPCIYFEVVSRDSWSRFRTEGLTYLVLPVSQPGIHTYELNCLRVKSNNPVSELRRLFIGDYGCISNLNWIRIPNDYEDNIVNKFGTYTVGTGQLEVRLNIVSQSQAFLGDNVKNYETQNPILEKLRSSSLVKSVEQVLQAFRIAKRNMILARKNV